MTGAAPRTSLADSEPGPAQLSPDEARAEFRRELLQPEYAERDLLERFLRWALRALDRLTEAASSVPPLSYLAAIALALLLVLALGLVLSRLGGAARERSRAPAVLLEEGVTASALRERARQALAEDRNEDALVDAFRALAVRQVELRRVEDVPGATAHEVADSLGEVFAEHRTEITAAADLFDRTLYGDQQVGPEQARALLDLESELAGAR